VSISPDPIEKYITPPEKVPVPVMSQRSDSGEPSAPPMGNLTRESTASPSFPLKAESSSLTSLSTPNQLTDEDEVTEEQVRRLGRGIEEIQLTSVDPNNAQHEPTFTNGGNVDEGSGDEDGEEGELHEGRWIPSLQLFQFQSHFD